MTVLSLETSKKVYELCGDIKTEMTYAYNLDGEYDLLRNDDVQEHLAGDVPAISFSELIRLLPKIGEKKGWRVGGARAAGQLVNKLVRITALYVNAPTEPEGMAAVESYLLSIL